MNKHYDEGWGSMRAYLESLPGSDRYGRHNLYLHDSHKGFTHGCVETAHEIFYLIISYRDAGHKYINFNISYPNSILLQMDIQVIKIKKIARILLSILFILNVNQLNAQVNSDIEFKAIPKDYSINKGFSFTLKNMKNQTYYYHVGLEEFSNGEWQEVKLDIDPKSPDKTVHVRILKANRSEKLNFNTSKYFNDWIPRKMPLKNESYKYNYRFVLYYASSLKGINKKIYSSVFKVK